MHTQNFLLGSDRFGLLVPRKLAVTPSKRRRTSARSKSRSGRHQSIPAPKPCRTDHSSAKVATDSHKGLIIVKERTLKRKGGNAGKGTPKASVRRQDLVRAIQDENTQIGDNRDRAGSSIEKHASQSSALSRSTEIQEISGSKPEVQREGGLLRTANHLRSDAGSPAESEDPIDELVHAGDFEKRDGRNFFTNTSSNSFLIKASSKARETHDQHIFKIDRIYRKNLYALDLASGTLC